ncbi:putative baseplate assembly protein [Paracoccaceae bacterium Fryx2]|nr:putative baseplate assembly protein [Paracoccaceae bacterium Fryx2]
MSLDDAPGCAHGGRAPRPRNRPGLTEVAYGTGTQPELLAAMLDALSRDPNLSRLTTRALSDPAISLIDAWAMVLDILSFYQARIANEGWLRTATERRSVMELARMVGYELNPGVAASTWLAFTVQAQPAGGEVYPMPRGMKVQSIPGPGETSQLFETSAELAARPTLNALRPRQTAPQVVGRRTTSLWLAGTQTNLAPGDPILLVGPTRAADPGSERWDMRVVTEVLADPVAGRTRVSWRDDLGHTSPVTEPAETPEAYAFGLRASLFGHNAPDYRVMPESVQTAFPPSPADDNEWDGFAIASPTQRRIDLDRDHDAILPESWLVLEQGGLRELYRVEQAETAARADFTLTGRVTRLTLDTDESLAKFGLRGTVVHAVSRPLPRAEAPLETPLTGDAITLDGPGDDLVPGQSLILRGRLLTQMQVAPRGHVFRQGAGEVAALDPPLTFLPDGGVSEVLAPATALTVLGPPGIDAAGVTIWPLAHPDGRAGTVRGAAGRDLLPLPPQPPEDAFAPPDEALYTSEHAVIRRIDLAGGLATLVLETPLAGVYWRPSVTLNGNVVAATHGATRVELTSALTGETFTETLGSGDGAQGMQSFRLSQKPLTHTQAATPSGGKSSLTVRVDGLAWTEVPTLYGQPADARVYATRPGADGHRRVMFGDGRFGARLPAGQGNVVATYRIGIGLAGQVRAGQLTLPLDQPLGLRSVVNPLPATGAQDPEAVEDARHNAPLTVLTLDRIVSVRDFEDFARAFAGIGMAQATPIWSGERQVVHITATGADGGVLDPDGTTLANLRDAIDCARHAERPVVVAGHAERRFGLTLRAAVTPGMQPAPVLAALRAALLARYGSDGQALAQGVEASRVIAEAQGVAGVLAVILADLDGQPPATTTRLLSRRARWSAADAAFLPAELLLIDRDRLVIEEIEP